MVVIGDKNIKELVGTVTSAQGDKTIVVSVETVKMDEKVRKRYSVLKKYYAHDESNSAELGDVVRIREHRPMSKLKRRNLIEIVQKVEKAMV